MGDVESKAKTVVVLVDESITSEQLVLLYYNYNSKDTLLVEVSGERKNTLKTFITNLYRFYTLLHFTYLEINPLVVTVPKFLILCSFSEWLSPCS